MALIEVIYEDKGQERVLSNVTAVASSVAKLKKTLQSPLGLGNSQLIPSNFAAPAVQGVQAVMKQIAALKQLAATPIQTKLFQNLAGPQLMQNLTPQVQAARQQMAQFNQQMGVGAQKAQGFGIQLGFLGRLIVAMGVRKVVHDVVELTDAYASFENKLRVVVPSAERLKIAQEDLVKIAIDSRTPLEETGILFSRITQATAALGKTQTQVTQFTSTMTKAIQVSGATSNEAKNAIIQLSQGMALGTLRGQDLKSVLEFLPYVSQLIADKMGVAVGQLKALGAAGKITTDTVFQGIIESTAQVEAKFALLKPRVSEMFEVLKTKYTVALGEAGTLQDAMVKGLKFLADNFDTVVRSAAALAAGITLLWTSNAMIGLAAFVAANPFTLFIAGLAAATVALVTFGDKIHIPGDELLSLQDIAVGSMGQIGNTLKDQGSLALAIADNFLDLWQAVAGKGKGTDWTMEAAKAMDLLRVLSNPEWLIMEPLAALGVLGDDLGNQVKKDVNATQLALEEIRKAKTGQNKVDSTAKVNDELARWRMGLQDSTAKGVPAPPPKGKKEAGKTFAQLIDEATFRAEVADDDDDITRKIETKLHVALEKLKPSIKKWGFDLNKEMAAASAAYDKKVKNNIDDWDPEKENSLTTMTELNDKALEQFKSKKALLQKQSAEYQKQVDLLREQIALAALHEEKRKKQLADEKAGEKLLDVRLKKMLAEEKFQENKRRENQQFLVNNVQSKRDRNQSIAEELDPNISIRQKIAELEQFKDAVKTSSEATRIVNDRILELKDSMSGVGEASQIFKTNMNSIFGVGGSMVQGIGDAIAGAKNLDDALRQVFANVAKQALSSLIQLPLNMAIGALTQGMAGPGIGSLAGGLVGPDGKATKIDVVGTSSPYKNTLPGHFASGGYTGNYGTSTPAGIVHGQEYVVNAEATRKYMPLLETINKGGSVGGGGDSKVVIHNYAGVQVEATNNNGEIAVMITKAIREQTGPIVAQHLKDPSSPVSRSMNRYFAAERQRL